MPRNQKAINMSIDSMYVNCSACHDNLHVFIDANELPCTICASKIYLWLLDVAMKAQHESGMCDRACWKLSSIIM